MPRNLSYNLDHIMTDATKRQPDWVVRIYDVRSTLDTINDVVLFNAFGTGFLDPLTGPRDFTADVQSIQVRERRGDYVNGGVQSSEVRLSIVDETGLFDPLLIIDMNPASAEYQNAVGRFLRAGNVVVVILGDSRVDMGEWPTIFTGAITGQVGRARSRSDGPKSTMTVRALGREARFLQYNRTSNSFGTAESFKNAATNIAQNEMGLDADEIDFGTWGSQNFQHKSVQFVEEPPLVMIAQLMFPDGLLPKFDGRGILTHVTSLITGAPDRVYENLDVIRHLDRPLADIEQPNCVTVVGLDKNLTKISQPPGQRLRTLELTTGFFASDEEVTVYWTDDQTLVAEDIEPRVLKSVAIGIFGGGEEFTEIPAPGPGGGSIGIILTISTGFAPWVATFFLLTYVLLALIPDEVAVFFTIPFGRVIQAIALAAAVYIMTQIGRGSYEFLGTPIEYVYKEIRETACDDGKTVFDGNTIEIQNHLINTSADAVNAAKNTLFLLQAEENVRSGQMLHDLRLEPDDIFEIPGNQTYLIDEISYTLIRNPARVQRATVKCFETTPGVLA
jgi:hypothetical protein